MIYPSNFEECSKIWTTDLWPNSNLGNKPLSSTKIEGNFDKKRAKETIKYYTYKIQDKIVGTMSGYVSTENYYRQRGLWVHSDYRNMGLMKVLVDQISVPRALEYECKYVWSIIRLSLLPIYKTAGFQQYSKPERGTPDPEIDKEYGLDQILIIKPL